MPKAGWCEGCKAYQWLAEDGGCVRGHDASTSMVSAVYEAEPDRGALEGALASMESAAERAGEVAKQAWDEAKPSMQEATKSAGQAAVDFADGVKRFGTVVFRGAPGTPATPPPAPPQEPAAQADGEEAAPLQDD